MYFLLYFNIQNYIDGLRYPLPPIIDIAALDDSLTIQRQEQIISPETQVYTEDAILESWRAIIKTVIEKLSDVETRILIFPTNHHLSTFHIMKSRCKLHTDSSGNGILEKMGEAANLDEMISLVQTIEANALPDHPAIFPHRQKKKSEPKNNMLSCSSYSFMADTDTGIFHALDSPCLALSDPSHWRGLGKTPLKSGFRPCPVCVQDIKKQKVPKKRPSPRPKHKSKAEIMQKQLVALSEQYDMHAEIVGGIAYITTIAGEWYFHYNDRPIKLYHKNTEQRTDQNGNPTGYYHTQPLAFHAPLQVLAYIRNHEKAEIRRLMQSNGPSDLLLK